MNGPLPGWSKSILFMVAIPRIDACARPHILTAPAGLGECRGREEARRAAEGLNLIERRMDKGAGE